LFGLPSSRSAGGRHRNHRPDGARRAAIVAVGSASASTVSLFDQYTGVAAPVG
jgi:hypothetical protein